MKKFALLLICMMAMLRASAVPAYPQPVTVTQPDGTTLQIQGHGDEFHNFITTADGYTIVKNEAGYYVYALLQGDKIAPSQRIARNLDRRSADDRAFLQATGKMLTESAAKRSAQKARHQVATKESDSYYQNFRGLVIMISFKDRGFSRSDIHSIYDHMFNDYDYQGYTKIDGSADVYGSMFIGGVRDYFSVNSMGKFEPQFDVIGPIQVDWNSYDVKQVNYAADIFAEAIEKADAQVDFSKYDADGDGVIDMMYFVVAGYGANYSGNSTDYLWPHKSSLIYYDLPLRDGKRLGKYACSVELYGWESQRLNILEGIGTICHEFSHVLGLPDEYDTNYEEGGQSLHPGEWSVMSGGSYRRYGRCPVGYSAYQRYASGFLVPTVIDKPGEYKLRPMQKFNEAYMLKTPVPNEYFLLENRQRIGWDLDLPGHGMLVFRVDSTNASVWNNNTVNANAAHNYYELLRAGGKKQDAQPSDPFPGTANVTVISNHTTPSLCTWNGTMNPYTISEITEYSSNITFKVEKEGTIFTKIEDFETTGATSTSGANDVPGRFCSWNFAKCNVTAPGSETMCDDKYSVAMKKPSSITSSTPLPFKPFAATIHFFNPTGTAAKFKLQYMLPTDSVWVDAKPSEASVAAKTDNIASFTFPSMNEAPIIRVMQTAGSTTAKVYVDNIALTYIGSKQAGDVNGDGEVNVSDVTALINKILGTATFDDEVCDINADGQVNVSDVTALINMILG
ncbi:MAG: M6 family metalloprotease domain-containing protein [Bacteroidales bacterium]|nr:M6 family metalloprotease domain-containing protein [Bacteroidales bacterium]